MDSLYNSSLNNCYTPQTFDTYYDFFQCYKFFVKQYVTTTILEILICIGTSVANFLVIVCLLFKSKKTIFDQIIIGHGKLSPIQISHSLSNLIFYLSSLKVLWMALLGYSICLFFTLTMSWDIGLLAKPSPLFGLRMIITLISQQACICCTCHMCA